MDETALIERCRARDREAQRELYEEYSRRIYNLALRMTRNADDAFEIAQDTFVRVFERIDSFDRRSQFGTWLHRIATNEALQLLRRRKIRQKHLRLFTETRPVHTDENPATDYQDLEEALARLTDEARAILLLRYQEGLDYAAIAEVFDCRPGTVASRLSRARAELRRNLDDSGATTEEKALREHPT